jgi:hypothetical protein
MALLNRTYTYFRRILKPRRHPLYKSSSGRSLKLHKSRYPTYPSRSINSTTTAIHKLNSLWRLRVYFSMCGMHNVCFYTVASRFDPFPISVGPSTDPHNVQTASGMYAVSCEPVESHFRIVQGLWARSGSSRVQLIYKKTPSMVPYFRGAILTAANVNSVINFKGVVHIDLSFIKTCHAPVLDQTQAQKPLIQEVRCQVGLSDIQVSCRGLLR